MWKINYSNHKLNKSHWSLRCFSWQKSNNKVQTESGFSCDISTAPIQCKYRAGLLKIFFCIGLSLIGIIGKNFEFHSFYYSFTDRRAERKQCWDVGWQMGMAVCSGVRLFSDNPWWTLCSILLPLLLCPLPATHHCKVPSPLNTLPKTPTR